MNVVAGSYKDDIGRRLAAWYIEKTGINFYTVYTATGYLSDDGEIKAVAIYTDYNSANIELHFIGRGYVNRFVIKSIAQYVFNQLGCIRLTTKILRRDKHYAKLFVRLGFEYECTLKSYYGLLPEQDTLVFRIFRPQAEKWMK